MKKWLCAVFAVLMLLQVCACSGAGMQEEEVSGAGEPTRADESKADDEEDVPTILVSSKAFASDNQILQFAKHLHEGYDVKLEVLPDNGVEREAELARIRAEIMAGGGPDAFVLPANEKGIYLNDGSLCVALFTNVEKAMESKVFLPMDDLIAQSTHLNMEDHYDVIMNAGRTEEGQVVLPLAFSCPAYFVQASYIEDPQAEYDSWEDILACDDENVTSFIMSRRYDWFDSYYLKLADYENLDLLITPEEISGDLAALDKIPNQADVSEMGIENIFSENAMMNYIAISQNAYVLTIPNKTDGLTATITAYAAINRNTEHAETVFQFIELLYDDVIQDNNGASRDGYHYYQGSRPSMVVGNSYGVATGKNAYPEAQTELIARLTEKVNCVRFASDLDSIIPETCSAVVFCDTEEEYLEAVEEICTEMEMVLVE